MEASVAASSGASRRKPNATAIFRELHPGIPHKMAVITLGCVPNTEMDFRTFEDLGPGGTLLNAFDGHHA